MGRGLPGNGALHSSTFWATGTWHTLVAMKTSTQLCLYKNGVADGCGNFTASNTDMQVPGEPVQLGCEQSGGSQPSSQRHTP